MTGPEHAGKHGQGATTRENPGIVLPFLLICLMLFAPLLTCSVFLMTAAGAAEQGAEEADDPDAATTRYPAPFTDGMTDMDSWVDADEVLGDSLYAGRGSATLTRLETGPGVVEPRPVRLIPPGSRPVPQIPEIPMRLSRTAVGLYAGFPSAVGALVSAPVDGPLGFRFGLAAFPGVGVAWSPGFEVRFGQERGTYSRDGYHCYGNLIFGRTYIGEDRELSAAEAGVGYRWTVSDRQGIRWIAAAELGGRWGRRSSGWPDYPSLRVYWILADW